MNTGNLKNNLIILILLLGQLAFSQETQLFKIIENNRFGFINNKGDQVIPYKYIDAEEFSEGLASVRVKGLYGFINTKGKMVIPPKYEYAGSFVNGIADVYIDGEVRFIDKEGKIILPQAYRYIELIDKEHILFRSRNNTIGIYNLKTSTEVFALDSRKYTIWSSADGVTVVGEIYEDLYYTDFAVVGLDGNFIVDFGMYSGISSFYNGYATVRMKSFGNRKESIEGVINTKGEVVFKRRRTENARLGYKRFHNGYTEIRLKKERLSEEKGDVSSNIEYKGYINLKGEVVFNDTLVKDVYNFSDNRAFIEDFKGNYYVIDTNFNRLNITPFKRVINSKFINGYAVVDTEDGLRIIDSNANFVVKPNYDQIIHKVGVIDSLFFYGIRGYNGKNFYGIKHVNGKVITQPILERFDTRGFNNGLLKAKVNNRLTYLDTLGNIVWQEKIRPTEETDILDISYKRESSFYAYSKGHGSKDGKEGLATLKGKTNSKINKANSKKVIDVRIEDNVIYVQNLLTHTVKFEEFDSMLKMRLQAKDKNGDWKFIERLPSLDCGTGSYFAKLERGEYWYFELPPYNGGFKTQIRVCIDYIDPTTNKQVTAYSNSIKGSINLGQFWRELRSYNKSIVVPNNE